MERHLEVLGVIGARSGSKGIPHKNVQLLAGEPLLTWIIRSALASRRVSRLVVSTDSEVYADVARRAGAEVPYLRPPELAGDLSTDFDYVHHLVRWLEEEEGYVPDIVIRLMATVPLQSADDIEACIDELIRDPVPDSVVAIAEARQHPMKALKLIDDEEGAQRLVGYFTESGRDVTGGPRQAYEPAYFRANIIACWRRVIFETASLTGDRVRHHLVPPERAVDIDTAIDLELVEYLLRRPGPDNHV